MTEERPIAVGAVIYDPKVTVIWGIIRDFFADQGVPIDLIFYSNYERQVDGLVTGHVDVAWNSPLAWLDSQRRLDGHCRAIAMRDTDRDRATRLVVRRGGPVASVEDLRGKTIACGAEDSPQATLIPLEWLRGMGLDAGKDFTVRRFDARVGLHGDHVGGELDAFRCLERGEAEASVMLDLNWDRWTSDGTISGNEFRVLASTDEFDHCCFTVRADFPAEQENRFLGALFAMHYDNPKHREMMDMEGLQAWVPGRISGYRALADAVASQNYFARGEE